MAYGLLHVRERTFVSSLAEEFCLAAVRATWAGTCFF